MNGRKFKKLTKTGEQIVEVLYTMSRLKTDLAVFAVTAV